MRALEILVVAAFVFSFVASGFFWGFDIGQVKGIAAERQRWLRKSLWRRSVVRPLMLKDVDGAEQERGK